MTIFAKNYLFYTRMFTVIPVQCCYKDVVSTLGTIKFYLSNLNKTIE